MLITSALKEFKRRVEEKPDRFKFAISVHGSWIVLEE
jgi:hypothetical protein